MMKNLIMVLFLTNSSILWGQEKPTEINIEFFDVENRVEDSGELVESENFSAGKIGASQIFIQTSKNKIFTQTIFGEAGSSASKERTFSNFGLNLNYRAQYLASQISFSLIGNWGRGQNISQSLTLEDTLALDDPNGTSDRYLQANVSYNKKLDPTSEFNLSLAKESLVTYNQNVDTSTCNLSLQKVLSVRSSLGGSILYSVQKSQISLESIRGSLGLTYSYRISEKSILSLQGGQSKTKTGDTTAVNDTGGVLYTYLFFRNKILQKAFSSELESEDLVSSSPEKIQEQLQNQTFANSFIVGWSRTFNSAEQGAAEAITETTLLRLNSEVTSQSSVQVSISNADQENNGDIVSNNYVRSANVEYQYRLNPNKEEFQTSDQFRVSVDVSETKNIEYELMVQRRLFMFAYLIYF